MSYDITLEELEAQPVLCQKHLADADQLQPAIVRGFHGTMRYAREVGAVMSGPPYTRFHPAEGGKVEVEGGMPVTAPTPGDGETLGYSRPAGPAATLTHVGPYDGLEAAHAAIEAWARAQGRQAASPPWDVYITDPGAEPDPSKWMTRVLLPLVG